MPSHLTSTSENTLMFPIVWTTGVSPFCEIHNHLAHLAIKLTKMQDICQSEHIMYSQFVPLEYVVHSV